jgi:co-chaperonin GroES (HSP10)
MAKIIPGAGKVIVRAHREEKERKMGNIIIPETQAESARLGIVVAAGPPLTREFPEFIAAKGDKVAYLKQAGVEIIIDEERLIVLNHPDVFCVIEDD